MGDPGDGGGASDGGGGGTGGGASVATGTGALHRLLAERTDDLRALDVAGFRDWLDRRLARWMADPVFAQRTVVREIRRRHPALAALERERRRAAAADAAAPGARRLGELARAMEGARKAVAGLGGAMEGAEPERRETLRRRRDAKQAEYAALAREHEALARASPERQALLRAHAAWERLRAATGLDRAEARLRELERTRGRGAGRRGAAFEETALSVTRRFLLPRLGTLGGREEGVRVLRGVTLGAAGMELDQLVVRPGADPGAPAEALALVEVKRNPDDLAHGFRRRQADLAWLTGDTTRYDPDDRRTSRFPAGHFDRPAVHAADGERTVLARASFAGFRPDPGTGWFLDGLYLVTRPGTLRGVSGAALGRIAHRVATDVAWAPESDAYLGELLAWARSLAGAMEAPDVVRTFAASERRARQLLLVTG